MIRNTQDLASYLGAYEDTSKSIARRVCEDTSAGCPAGVEKTSIGEIDRTYVVKCRLSILGYKVLTWRPPHGKTRGTHYHPLPPELAEHLWVGEQQHLRAPTIGAAGLKPIEVAREFGSKWMASLILNDYLLRKTYRGGCVYLTIKVAAKVMRDAFWVMGYCEGSDREHEVYHVPFPCSPDEIDEAIGWAEVDSKETWDATHGCDKCNPEGTCDEYGNVFAPGEIGAPINPDCPSCEGAGIIL